MIGLIQHEIESFHATLHQDHKPVAVHVDKKTLEKQSSQYFEPPVEAPTATDKVLEGALGADMDKMAMDAD